jgi:hypothetical protein
LKLNKDQDIKIRVDQIKEVNCPELQIFKTLNFVLSVSAFCLTMVFMARLNQAFGQRFMTVMHKACLIIPLMFSLNLIIKAMIIDLCPWADANGTNKLVAVIWILNSIQATFEGMVFIALACGYKITHSRMSLGSRQKALFVGFMYYFIVNMV